MNNKRSTSEQLELLVSWVADRPSMVSGRCEGPDGRIASKSEWDELAQTLNAIRFGAKKPGEKWQQTWRDLKGNAKQKASRHRVELVLIIGRDVIDGTPIYETLMDDVAIEVLPQLPGSDEEASSAMPGPVPTDVLPATPGPSGVKRKASDKDLFTKRALMKRFVIAEEEKMQPEGEKHEREGEAPSQQAQMGESGRVRFGAVAGQHGRTDAKFREALIAEL